MAERSLKAYRERRDPKRSPEPRGRRGRSARRARFVVQEHQTRSHHFDFRLEVEGVLKSWAVPKGASTDPREKRLAVPVEDHPLDYADFEGVIPEGQYGAGAVVVWDRGSYDNLTERDGRSIPVARALEDGHLLIRLHGEKLKGGYALQRVATGKDERWLLIKMKDEAADARRRPTKSQPRSVLSGRTVADLARRPMADLLAQLDARDRQRLEAAPHPSWCEPELAKLTDERFSDPAWLFERKLDGERALAFRHGTELRLLSRNRKPLTSSYPELVDALAAQVCDDFVVDGEVVAFDGQRSSFARLQQRMHIDDPQAARASRITVSYYLFDLLHLDGHDLRHLPLRRRKALLRRAIGFRDPLRFTSHRDRAGEALFREACGKRWEGLIAKRADAPYRGGRSSDWLKFKCGGGQELVIAGFSAARGSRKGFGALLLGYYDRDRLRYAGKVGTGFDDRTLVELRRRLDCLARTSSPFADEVRDPSVTFVQPKLVAEIGFSEWTADGRLRHPRFRGLRRDKRPEEVSREWTVTDGG